jgi:hypothetical protein
MYTETVFSESLPSVRSPLLGFNLDSIIPDLKKEKKWVKGEMNSKILLKNSSWSLMLVVLHENTEIISKLIKNQIVFEILEGQVKFYSPKGGKHILKSGYIFTLNESQFRIDSLMETAFLMTIYK